MEQSDALLHCFLDLGEAMLAVGADVNRVEDSLSRLGLAYGAARMNVFVITSSIVVTMVPAGRPGRNPDPSDPHPRRHGSYHSGGSQRSEPPVLHLPDVRKAAEKRAVHADPESAASPFGLRRQRSGGGKLHGLFWRRHLGRACRPPRSVWRSAGCSAASPHFVPTVWFLICWPRWLSASVLRSGRR